MLSYVRKVREYLYDKEILPRIKNGSKLSIEEIVKKMKPIPYENSEYESLRIFARTMRLITESKKSKSF